MSTIDALLRVAFRRARSVVAGYNDVQPFLSPVLPVNDEGLAGLPVVERIATVALLKRYEQLQDIISQLCRLVADWEGIATARLTRRDYANLLERFGAVDDADDYVAATELRNRLVHDYPLDESEQTVRVNLSWQGFPQLVAMVDGLHRHMAGREFDFHGS